MSDQVDRSMPILSAGARGGWLRTVLLTRGGRRRRVLVNPRFQVRNALRSLIGMGLLISLMLAILLRVRGEEARELLDLAPFLRDNLERQDRLQFLAFLGGGLLFLAGAFVVEILQSHRTAGALHNLRRRMEELRGGHYAARLNLRRHDDFPELVKCFNEAMDSLKTRAEGELATLGRLSAQAAELLREEARGNHARVRLLAETLHRCLEEVRNRKSELLSR